jgi:poly-beta-1,6-N-acetyl-D-glucosamine synthase
VGYMGFELIQICAALYYTNNLKRDAAVCAVFPLIPIYQAVLLLVRLVATTEEIFFRTSYTESFVPDRIRNATWHW